MKITCHISQEESEKQNSWEAFKAIMELRLSVANKKFIKIDDFDLNPLSTALHGEVSAQRYCSSFSELRGLEMFKHGLLTQEKKLS